MTLPVLIIPIHYIEASMQVSKPPAKAATTFKLRMLTHWTDAETKNSLADQVKKTIATWHQIIADRNQQNHYYHSLQVDDYKDLLEMIEKDIAYIDMQPPHSLLILTDANGKIQGLASTVDNIQKKLIYVNILVTAAWNVNFGGENSDENKKFIAKGVGTTLMRQIYELALRKKLPLIELTTTPSSASFYKNHLKMQMNKNVAWLEVSDVIPKPLQVPSGNLLS